MEGKGSSFILLLIVAFLSITIAALAIGYFFVGNKSGGTETVYTKVESTKPADSLLASIAPFEGSKNFNLKKPSEKSIAVIMLTCEIKYYIKVDGVKAPATKLELYKADIVKAIGSYFMNVSLEEAGKEETKEHAEKEIADRINKLLLENEPKVKGPIVYQVIFGDWFYQ